MFFAQAGINVPLIKLQDIHPFDLEEDILCGQTAEAAEALWKALANHQRGLSLPLPKPAPLGSWDKSQLQVK